MQINEPFATCVCPASVLPPWRRATRKRALQVCTALHARSSLAGIDRSLRAETDSDGRSDWQVRGLRLAQARPRLQRLSASCKVLLHNRSFLAFAVSSLAPPSSSSSSLSLFTHTLSIVFFIRVIFFAPVPPSEPDRCATAWTGWKISSKWPASPDLEPWQAWDLDGNIVDFTVLAEQVA